MKWKFLSLMQTYVILCCHMNLAPLVTKDTSKIGIPYYTHGDTVCNYRLLQSMIPTSSDDTHTGGTSEDRHLHDLHSTDEDENKNNSTEHSNAGSYVAMMPTQDEALSGRAPTVHYTPVRSLPRLMSSANMPHTPHTPVEFEHVTTDNDRVPASNTEHHISYHATTAYIAPATTSRTSNYDTIELDHELPIYMRRNIQHNRLAVNQLKLILSQLKSINCVLIYGLTMVSIPLWSVWYYFLLYHNAFK